MNKKQAFTTLEKYRYKHKTEQEAAAADIAQAFRRVAVSADVTLEQVTEAMKGIVIMPAIVLNVIKFLRDYNGRMLDAHESL